MLPLLGGIVNAQDGLPGIRARGRLRADLGTGLFCVDTPKTEFLYWLHGRTRREGPHPRNVPSSANTDRSPIKSWRPTMADSPRTTAHHWIARLGVLVFLAALAAPLEAQLSRHVPLPTDGAAAVNWSSRVIHNWYETDTLHVFLMIDGFRVEQGKWSLTARDGVVWFDEKPDGNGGRKILAVYAEDNVVVQGPGIEAPLKFDSIYLTLRTKGEVGRQAAPGEDKLKRSDGTPLYLRGKRVRLEVLAKAPDQPVPPLPEPEPTTPPDETPKPAADETPKPGPDETPKPDVTDTVTPEPAPDEPVPDEVTVRPIDDVRQVTIVSVLESPERRVTIYSGGVSVMVGDLEMKADDAVVWTNEGEARQERGLETKIYLEGHVVMNEGPRTIRATRVYYDAGRRQALIIDAAIRTFSRAREVPVYYYAKRARQLAEGKFVAEDASFTTSDMGHPYTAVHGREFQFTDLTETDEDGQERRRIRYSADHVTTSIRGVPTSYWPRMAGDVEQGETALRRVQLTQRSNRGTGIESEWHLWKLLGFYREPVGFKKTYLNLNFYSERGPYIAAESRYAREDFFGDALGAFTYDSGKDSVGGDSVEPDHKPRGRIRLRHRHFLPRDWQATIETSYISDRNFLNEWYEREWKEGKDQETLLHLKKQWDRQAVSILMKGRINDFQTETEALPRLEYHLLGQPLWGDRLTYHTSNVYEYANFAPDDRLGGSSGWTNIADTQHEVSLPEQIGFVKVVPFVDGRASYFEKQINHGADSRLYGAAGVRASWYLSKVYEYVRSELWDLNRLRHVNTFDVEAIVAGTDLGSRRLYAYDEPGSAETKLVRGVDDTDVYRFGWRQRWQTKRGREQKTVDWITFDVLMTWFGNSEPPRVSPDDDRSHNNLQMDYAWQLSDTTSVVGDLYYTPNDGEVRLANVGLSVIRSPRLSYYIGSRYIRGAESSVATFGLDYVINRKWRIHLFDQVDFNQSNRNSSMRVDVIRRMGNWYMTIGVELDPGEDDKIFYVQFEPVGVPEFRFGN